MDLGPVGQAGHPVVPTVNISGKTFFNISSQTFLTVYQHMARKSLNVDVDIVQPILFRLELDEKKMDLTT